MPTAALYLAAIVAGTLAGLAWWDETPAEPSTFNRFGRLCVLSIPPPQVTKVAKIEAIYLSDARLGWLIVSDPVECD